MLLMSSNWLPAMEADVLNVVSYAEVWTPPSLANAHGVFLARFMVTDGGVTIDSTNAIRRSVQSVRLVPYITDPTEGFPPGLPVPNVNSDELFPSGNELTLHKGYWKPGQALGAQRITLPWLNGGSPVNGETARLGRFVMEDVEIYNEPGAGDVYIELSGRDRGATVDRSKFTVPYATDGTSTLPVQLAALITFAVPAFAPLMNLAPTSFVPAQMTFNIGDSPWTSALALAAAGGYELYFDEQGTLVGRPAPNPVQTAPSVSYVTGTPTSIVTSVQRSLITTAVPNVIVVISQGSNIATPLISYWWDSNQNSPTFYNSTVPTPGSNMASLPLDQGSYPTTVVTSTGAAATTQAQNDAIALSMGYATIGSQETVDIKIRDNPAHDVDDVIGLIDLPTTVDAFGTYVLDTITVACGRGQEMELKGRLVAK